jgi:hypothetical protein
MYIINPTRRQLYRDIVMGCGQGAMAMGSAQRPICMFLSQKRPVRPAHGRVSRPKPTSRLNKNSKPSEGGGKVIEVNVLFSRWGIIFKNVLRS